MPLHRRLTHLFVLLTVLLSLGDAPYVDEFLDDLAHTAADRVPVFSRIDHSAGRSGAPESGGHASATCQLLLNLPGVSAEVSCLPIFDGELLFPAETSLLIVSAPAGRIDRPPAPDALDC